MAIELISGKGAVSISREMAKGDDGGYYTPTVDESGNLSWQASEEGMPEIEPVNIKGEKGDKGDTGKDGKTPVHIGNDEPTDDEVLIWFNTDATPISSAEEVGY